MLGPFALWLSGVLSLAFLYLIGPLYLLESNVTGETLTASEKYKQGFRAFGLLEVRWSQGPGFDPLKPLLP
jgi:predicted small lipoprotein YifL